MLGQIELTTYPVEAVTAEYLFKGGLQPRGGLIAYFNDRQWLNIALVDTTVFPLAPDRRVPAMDRAPTVVSKSALQVVTILDSDQATAITLPPTGRQIVFYLTTFAVQGFLHVSSDAPDQDVFDETRDFFPLSSGSIFPLRPVATAPTREAPLMLLNRLHVHAYRVVARR